MYVLGNYERTLRTRRRYLLFFPLVLASMFVFHWLGEQESLRNNLSTTRDWDATAQAVYCTALAAIAAGLLLHAEYTRRHHRESADEAASSSEAGPSDAPPRDGSAGGPPRMGSDWPAR